MKRFMLLLLAVSVYPYSSGQERTKDKESLSLSDLLSGSIVLTDKNLSVESLQWNPHASFKGVYLKHFVVGENTNGQISCHIVKIDPYCELDTHRHSSQIEIHQVLKGSGTFYLGDKEAEYAPGTMSVIPADTPHKVVAGKDGLYLLAIFTPTLL